MPTIEAWNEVSTRAARLGYRVLIVAASHVELIDATTGREVARVGEWGEVVVWLAVREQETRWKRAA